MKNNKLYILAFALFTMILTSCEDVIILDLENEAPQLVVEAVLDANTQTIGILLTKSNGFYEDINLNTVDDATIVLTKEDGSTVDIPYLQNGYYVAGNLGVNTDEKLSLLVATTDGQEYRAVTNVPNSVTLDSIQVLEQQRPGFGGNGETSFQLFAHWQDEINVENFYRIRVTKNDTLQTMSGYTLSDDITRDGDEFSQPAIFQTFEVGDTVTVQLMSIDESSYLYFSDLSATQSQGLNSTTPFNPKSNFDNNALGYFGIFRSDTETVILQ